MITQWDVCLFSLGLILMTPKRGAYRSYGWLLTVAAITTVLALSWLHNAYLREACRAIPAIVCSIRIVRYRTSAGTWRMLMKGTVIAAFVYRCKSLYPFAHWHSVPCDVVLTCITCVLVFLFVSTRQSAVDVWSVVYLSIVAAELVFGQVFDSILNLYWQTETVFVVVAFMKHIFDQAFQRRTESTV